ncbi:MAG: PilZ domain-containing protein [Deltaproteobacteria bacterium]|nr:PilZ domain-containing protein [Deltaproteobacteria bacterium]
MSERRRYPRLDVNLPVILRYRGDLIPATVLNISCGGICLSTDNKEISSEGNAEVILDLSATEIDVSVRGQVVRVADGKNKKVGIQFTNLYSVGHKAIERYLTKNRKSI